MCLYRYYYHYRITRMNYYSFVHTWSYMYSMYNIYKYICVCIGVESFYFSPKTRSFIIYSCPFIKCILDVYGFFFKHQTEYHHRGLF